MNKLNKAKRTQIISALVACTVISAGFTRPCGSLPRRKLVLPITFETCRRLLHCLRYLYINSALKPRCEVKLPCLFQIRPQNASPRRTLTPLTQIKWDAMDSTTSPSGFTSARETYARDYWRISTETMPASPRRTYLLDGCRNIRLRRRGKAPNQGIRSSLQQKGRLAQ